MLTLTGCRFRQDRLRDLMRRESIDVAVLTSPPHIFYFSGLLDDPRFPHALIIARDGGSVLVTSHRQPKAAVDESVTYESYSIQRVLDRAVIHKEAAAVLATKIRKFGTAVIVGLEPEWMNHAFSERLSSVTARVVSLTLHLMTMRRAKESDEVTSIRDTIALIDHGYAAAKSTIATGINECDVYNVMYTAVVSAAGTSVQFGGDFATGNRTLEGGPPTTRRIAEGDLFVLDIFPCYRGYFGDLCRTFAASSVSDLQFAAWRKVVEALTLAESMLRPGTRTADIYNEVRRLLDEFESARGSFFHHAGHGVGLDGQEHPWLTPGSSQILAVNDVIAVEPGLYSEALQGGLRLEQNYLITETGFERLSNFPLEMK
jgi:Xaa-Pro aminopeptidase